MAEQRAAERLRAHSAAIACRRGAADRGGYAAGARSGDLQFDSADRDDTPHERPDVHAELRWAAAIFADRWHALIVCRELLGAGDSGRTGRLLRGGRGRLVHLRAGHGTVDHRHLGADGDLYDTARLAALLRHLREDLRGDAAICVRRLHAGLFWNRDLALRNGRLRYRVCLLALDRIGLVSAALHLRCRGRARSTTPGSVSLSASRWVSPRRHGWSRTGAARVIPRRTGAAIRAAARRVRMSTDIGAAPLTPARAAGMRAAEWRDRPSHGSYATARGTTGNINAGRQYNAWTGNASRGYDRTFNTAAGGSGNVARGSNYNTYTGQRSTANAVSGTTANGSTYDRAGATTAGPQGAAHAGGGSVYNANTGKTTSWGADNAGNNHYADSSGNVYHSSGSSGWQQHSSSGAAKRERRLTPGPIRNRTARSAGDDRSSSFPSSFGQSFGGTAGGGGSGGIASAAVAAVDSAAAVGSAAVAVRRRWIRRRWRRRLGRPIRGWGRRLQALIRA